MEDHILYRRQPVLISVGLSYKQARRCHIKPLPIEDFVEWDFDPNLIPSL